MRTLFLFLLTLFFLSVSCDLFSDRPKPYDPVKAGAKIIDSFNITGQLGQSDLRNRYFDFAIHKDTIYIHVKGTLYVFDKETFNKINEIKINFPIHETLLYFGSVFGLVIIDECNGLILCSSRGNILMFSLDLETGDASLIENLKEKGIESNSILHMGYDRENDFIWILDIETINDYYFFYQYNKDDGIFTFVKSIQKFQNSMHIYRLFVSGDKWFYTGHSYTDPSFGTKTHIGVDRYDINNPSKIEHFINAEYLGTTTIPQNIIYDEPYIYMMVERNKQIQMLKLLPNK